MKLIVGLGNKGAQYDSTRHNIGFEFIDSLASSLKTQFDKKNKFSVYSESSYRSEKVILVKPMTYMNLSGQAVNFFASQNKIAPENILIIHDDTDIELYRVKIKMGGGNAGHNGVASVIEELQTEDFARVRIGVGRPQYSSQKVDYVLEKFPEAEHEGIVKKFPVIETFVMNFIADGYTKAAGRFKDE